MNIVDRIIEENTDNQGTAVIEGEHALSYPELISQIRLVADRLKAFGLKPGTFVVICLRGGIDYIVISLAVLLSGGVIVPVIETSGEDELNDVANTVSAEWLISGRPLARFSLIVSAPDLLEKPVFLFKIVPLAPTDPRLRALDPAFVRFSSGTTGESKGVILSHHAIKERTDAADQALQMNRHDRVIWVLNMSFHFVVTILLFLRRGSTIVICEEDFPRSFIRTIANGRPTLLYAAPFHYSLLANASELPKDIFSNVRLVVSTAMSLPIDIAERFHALFGLYPAQAYGIIEVGLPCVNTSQDPAKLLSVGKLVSGQQIKLVEPDDQGKGRILLKGKGFFDAYLKPLRLVDDVCPDGWFDTGDIGRIDDEGFLFITGRSKNMINFCGMKIFPEEVETILNKFQNVKESYVYAKPHPQYGQIVCADISITEPFDLDALRLSCYQQLAKYKVPKEFSIVSTIQRTPSGKLRR